MGGAARGRARAALRAAARGARLPRPRRRAAGPHHGAPRGARGGHRRGDAAARRRARRDAGLRGAHAAHSARGSRGLRAKALEHVGAKARAHRADTGGSHHGWWPQRSPRRTPSVPSADPPVTLIDNTQLALERAISGASMRQSVLANNLANAETPGFQRMDLDFHETLAAAMKSDDSGRIEATSFSAQPDAQTLRADGNGVDVDVESA